MSAALPQLHGLLVLDKPHGPTSAACLQKIKKQLGQKKIGHAGTLDPMATGVLLVLLGQGTKLAPYLTAGTKTYRGSLELGKETDTYDAQGHLLHERPWDHVDQMHIEREISAWLDLQEQIVPPYSAAKHKGKPLYALSRAGQEVPVKTKPVSIDLAQLLHVEFPVIDFRIRCTAGTYVRSLAHSLGKRLGCGAMLTALVREEASPFGLHQAHPLDKVLAEPDRLAEKVLSLKDSLPHWPRLTLDQKLAQQIQNGIWIPADQVPEWQPKTPGQKALLLSPQNRSLALAEARMHKGRLHWAVVRGLWGGR